MINTELRIGNLVFLDGKDVETVTGISTKEVRIENYFYDIDRITGIAITESMLLKSGFTNPYRGAWKFGKLSFDFNTMGKLRFIYSQKVTYIDYYHQVQNLVFALTGAELTYTEK